MWKDNRALSFLAKIFWPTLLSLWLIQQRSLHLCWDKLSILLWSEKNKDKRSNKFAFLPFSLEIFLPSLLQKYTCKKIYLSQTKILVPTKISGPLQKRCNVNLYIGQKVIYQFVTILSYGTNLPRKANLKKSELNLLQHAGLTWLIACISAAHNELRAKITEQIN